MVFFSLPLCPQWLWSLFRILFFSMEIKQPDCETRLLPLYIAAVWNVLRCTSIPMHLCCDGDFILVLYCSVADEHAQPGQDGREQFHIDSEVVWLVSLHTEEWHPWAPCIWIQKLFSETAGQPLLETPRKPKSGQRLIGSYSIHFESKRQRSMLSGSPAITAWCVCRLQMVSRYRE